MDSFTLAHLANWIDRQFGPDQEELTAAMIEQYEMDPEFYENSSWWKCHDDMISSHRSTL